MNTDAARQAAQRSRNYLSANGFSALAEALTHIRSWDRSQPTDAETSTAARVKELRVELDAAEKEIQALARRKEEAGGFERHEDRERGIQLSRLIRSLGEQATKARVAHTEAREEGGKHRVGVAKQIYLRFRDDTLEPAVVKLAQIVADLGAPAAEQVEHAAVIHKDELVQLIAQVGSQLEIAPPPTPAKLVALATVDEVKTAIRTGRHLASAAAAVVAELQAWCRDFTAPTGGLKWHNWTSGSPVPALLRETALILTGAPPSARPAPASVDWSIWSGSLRGDYRRPPTVVVGGGEVGPYGDEIEWDPSFWRKPAR